MNWESEFGLSGHFAEGMSDAGVLNKRSNPQRRTLHKLIVCQM